MIRLSPPSPSSPIPARHPGHRPLTADPLPLPLPSRHLEPANQLRRTTTVRGERSYAAPPASNSSAPVGFGSSPRLPTPAPPRSVERPLPNPPTRPSNHRSSPSELALAAGLSAFRMHSNPLPPGSAVSATGLPAAIDDNIAPHDNSRSLIPPPMHSRHSSFSSIDGGTAARNSLRAGSALANYNHLDLDFSFLDDEPPAKSSSKRISRAPATPRRKVISVSSSSAEDSDDDDRSGSQRTRAVFPHAPRRSEPRRSALPFPSRPVVSRRVSSDSAASRKSSLYSVRSVPSERPSLPSGLPACLTAGNRLSLASFVSTELSPGESPYRSSLSFPGRPSGYFDFAERRKRLAAFLDETAEAMEGGKSLNMVLPNGADRPLSQFVEPASPTIPTLAFPSNDTSPSTRCDSVYFTPRAEEHALDGREETSEQGPSSTGAGLDPRRSETRAQESDASPSTLRAASPSKFAHSGLPASRESCDADDDEARRSAAKLAEKRRRTIQELIDTERTYAIDMMVARDIYLARARGAQMTEIADYVMSSGLGLSATDADREASPVSPTTATFSRASIPNKMTRRSTSGSISVSATTQPKLLPGQPLMSPKDIQTVFANLEEIASLAEAFAEMLAEAIAETEEASVDRIGQTFLDMLPRIQKVYSTYCVRHHRAIVRLQELEPTLRPFFSECKTLSHGRTNAWDLASLLIKPVQRCLKYPLLLDQIVSATPEDHPDRAALQRANTDMLVVADAINESKKRSETVGRIVSKDKNSHRRDSSKSISSMGTTMTKKLLRTSQKAKGIFGAYDNGGDEIFDTLVALVESTRAGVVRFSNEMRDWSRSTRSALEAQVTLVEGWIDLYAPLGSEKPVEGGPHHRLCIFLDEVLIPTIEGPWRELDHEVRRSLIVKTDHLLSLFDNPRQVIEKRNDKLLDHHRYLSKKLPSDRKGSEDFIILSTQLLEELPRFLGSVSRYFNIIVTHFAGTQAAYHESLQQRWSDFSEQWIAGSPRATLADSVQHHTAAHQPMTQLMDSLAAGLGIAVAQSNLTNHRRTESRASRPVSANSTHKLVTSPAESEPRSRRGRQSYFSEAATDCGSHRDSFTASQHSSATSVSSMSPPNKEPLTPPTLNTSSAPVEDSARVRPSSTVTSEPLEGYDRNSMISRYDAPLPSVPHAADRSDTASSHSTQRRRSSVEIGPNSNLLRPSFDRTSSKKPISEYSLSIYEPTSEANEQDETFERDGPLYIAEAISSSQSSAYRAGYPILSFEIGDRLEVELEEADRAEGGSGWLLGRKVVGNGGLGWARTEDFAMLEEDEVDVEGDETTAERVY
ncbi:uncharacterized protein JCM15063_003542 [Sporobolomyces koalae]|uniref:uncharacterized protein n=1 Tax=Sporobolomyces koalae TaxID=500713 RepID=UPI0031784F05